MLRQNKKYAIAVRDGELFLFCRIRRNVKGEVFVLFPRAEKDWDPHTSYHADGFHHQKSFDHKFMVRKQAKPAENFSETVNVVTTGIANDEPRAINMPCSVQQFSEVLEIRVDDLRPEKYRTMISIDLTPKGGEPIITPGAQILSQRIFQDAVPWIAVTLFDTLRVLGSLAGVKT